MRHSIGVIDRYAARSAMLAVALTWLALSGFQLAVALSENAGDIGKNGYTLSHALLETLLTAPRRAYEVFPTSALIGCVLGLGALAARSELTAMRAVGISRWRIGLGAVLGVGLAALIIALLMETVGVAADQRAMALSNVSDGRQLTVAQSTGLWAREGNVYLNARSGAEREVDGAKRIVLEGVRLFEFDDAGRLVAMANARTATRRDGAWWMRDVQRTRFAQASVTVETKAEERWASYIDDKILVAAITKPRYMRLRDLERNIEFLRNNRLDAHAFEAAYWSRWFYPLSAVLLALAGLPFVFGSLRSGGFGKRLFFGIVIGVGFWLAHQTVLNLADVYRFDVRIAHLAPLLLLLGFTIWMMRRSSD